MKTVLILGAGIYQVPLIQRSKQLGFKTIVASVRGNYPGICIADYFEDVDTTDTNGIIAIAKKHQIDAILTTGTDVALPAIGAVIDELHLYGTGYKAAMKSTNKVLMKEAFKYHHVPTAKFVVVDSLKGAFSAADEIGYPLMVKAIDSSGSRGIMMVDIESNLKSAWDSAINISKCENILIEQYLVGVEFGAQAIIHGGNVVEVFIHNDTVTKPPFLTPIGHSMPVNFSEEVIKKIKNAIIKAVIALGIRDTIANVDLMLVDNEPMIIEIGARMGATCLPENISIYGGFDAYEHILNLSLGDRLELPTVYPEQANAALLLRSDRTGILDSIQVPKEILDHPRLLEIHLDKKPGDRVNKFVVGPDRVGDVVVSGDTSGDAELLTEEFSKEIRINVR